MKDNSIDEIIRDCIREEVKHINMSHGLRSSIRKNTICRKENIYERFLRLMDTTVEISLPSFVIACSLMLIFAVSSFRVTEDMKRDKAIQGYTNIKIINIGGTDVIVDSSDGGALSEKDKD